MTENLLLEIELEAEIDQELPTGRIHLSGKDQITIAQVSLGYENDFTFLFASAPKLLRLAHHIIAMSNDAYFLDHPEWEEIVNEAEAAIDNVKGPLALQSVINS